MVFWKGCESAMLRAWQVASPWLMGQGILMLCLGTVLSLIGCLMAVPEVDTLGYILAVVSTAGCLLVVCLIDWMGGLADRGGARHQGKIYLWVAALATACGVIVWLNESVPKHMHLLVVLAGFHGLFWGMWNLELALHLQDYPRTAVGLSVFGALTAAVGITIVSQFKLTHLEAGTALSCYTTLIGCEIVLIVFCLHRHWDLVSRPAR
jgi:uncharacterized membrane protein YiaA